MRRSRWAWLVVAGCAVGGGTAWAQAPQASTGSRYLPMDDWTYAYIGRLRDRGYLDGLNPLVQPYRRMEVARGLAALDPDTLREPVAGWVRLLREELGPELERLAGHTRRDYGFETMVGGRASTSRRLDATRPLGDAGAWPQYRIGAWVETGPIAAETRVYGDSWYRADPDGLDPGYDPRDHVGGKTDAAYVSATLPFGGLQLGRFARNWAPLGTLGLMVGDVATPYPQIGIDLRAGRVTLHAFTGELDTILSQKRYFSAHELTYDGHGRFYLSLGESILYASTYGGPALRYLNPLEFLFVEAETEPTDLTPNLMLHAQAWVRSGHVVLRGQFMLDDIDISGTPDTGRAPTRYGFDVGATYVVPRRPMSVSVRYRQVSAFAYRTNRIVDQSTYLQRSLGDNFTDYDRLTAGAEWLPPIRGLMLDPTVLIQRQGEGDVRVPFPPNYYDFIRSPSLFLGVRETTYRAALRGRFQPIPQLWLAWDAGPNLVHNKGHVVGITTTEFEATAEIGVRLELPR